MIPSDPSPLEPSSPEPPNATAHPSQASDLPAPYASPWGLLADDLRAVVADLRLQGLRWLRRNRQGDLPLPGFWPRDLAPVFWPLTLALVVVAALAVVWLVLGWPGSRGPGSIPQPERAERQQAQPEPAGFEQPQSEPANPPQPQLEQPQLEQPLPAASNLPGEGADVGPDAPDGAEVQATPEPDGQAALEQALASLDPGQWIAALELDPEGSLLRLQLTAGFTTLAASQQQKLAEDWQALALGFGFDRLELTDRQGRVLGRQAMVGSGMILLSPQHLS